MVDVITSQGGRNIIQQRLDYGVISGSDVSALDKIGKSSGTNFPLIKKTTVVRLLQLVLDIHQDDSQVINPDLAMTNQLSWQLSNARQQATCQQMAVAQDAAVQQQRAAQQQTVAPQQAAGQPQVMVEPKGVAHGTARGLIDIEAPMRSEVNKSAQTECITGVGEKKDKVKRQICIFFRRGNCKFGPLGHNKAGTCKFLHPMCCPAYELFGQVTNLGCKNSKKCRFLHRDICKRVAKFKKCTNTGCSYLHPKGLLRLLERNGVKEKGKFTMKPSDGINQENMEDMIVNLVKALFQRSSYRNPP